MATKKNLFVVGTDKQGRERAVGVIETVEDLTGMVTAWSPKLRIEVRMLSRKQLDTVVGRVMNIPSAKPARRRA